MQVIIERPRVKSLWLLTALVLFGCGEDKQTVFQIDLFDHWDEARDIELVSISGGTFAMGSNRDAAYGLYISPSGNIDTIYNFERPVHFTTISSFLISTTEITQAQYEAVTGLKPAKFTNNPDNPVEQVSWFDACDFCNQLSEMQGLGTCYDNDYNCDFSAAGYRLPKESEWEYCVRAGTTSEYYFAESPAAVGQAAWYIGNSNNITQPVGIKQPNNFGLYDVSGNVTEWVYDLLWVIFLQFSTGPHRITVQLLQSGKRG